MLELDLVLRTEFMVRKGGFEPPRLSAPPPQDGVSASFTTSADIFRCDSKSNNYYSRSSLAHLFTSQKLTISQWRQRTWDRGSRRPPSLRQFLPATSAPWHFPA